MGVQFKNNASTIVPLAISSTTTSLTVAAGTGTRFPALGTGDYFYATIQDVNNHFEIVKVTARVDDVMTIERAQEGTLALSFPANSRFELRVTAGSLAQAIEPPITAGTTTQYWRGDKSWRDFFADVRAATLTGLSTATNAVITATDTVLQALGKLQAQVTGKQDTLVSGTNIKTVNGNSLLGAGDVAVEPPITAGTTAQYWRGDKSWQTLNAAAISDSTAVGRSVLTAADAAAARSAIGVVSASETTQGIVELATVAEARAGTDATRAVTPAGAMGLVNQFGLGNAAPALGTPDDYLLGSFTAAELIESSAVSLGFPALGGAPSTPRHWDTITFGAPNRRTQIATEVFGNGTTRGRTFVRVKHDTTWHPWAEIYHSGNIDTAFNGVNQSLGSNGYQKLPGGLLIQWGTLSGSTDVSYGFFNYPIAFPSAIYSVVGTMINQAGGTSFPTTIFLNQTGSLSSCRYTLVGMSGAGGVYSLGWIAIGR